MRKRTYLTPIDIQILFFLYEYDKLTPSQIYRMFNRKVSERAVLYSLKKLVELGLVKKEINGNNTYYSLSDFKVKIVNGTAVIKTVNKIIVINCPFAATCDDECSPNCKFFRMYKDILSDILSENDVSN